MPQKPTILMILLTGVLMMSADQLYGQGYGYGSPALSPWLYLNQKQPAPVDNYHAFVQPQLDLRNTLQTQQADIQRNGASYNSLSNNLTAQQAFNAPASPTGIAAGFMNHGGYFNINRSQGFGAPGSGGAGRNFSGIGATSGMQSGASNGNNPSAPNASSLGVGGFGR